MIILGKGSSRKRTRNYLNKQREGKMSFGRYFRVHHKYIQGSPYSIILENARNNEDFLLFESGVIASLALQECEEFKKQYTKLADAYGCLGVLQLCGAEQAVHYLVMVTACISVGKIRDCDVYRVTGVHFHPLWRPTPPGLQDFGDERVAEIQRLVSGGMFYFGWSTSEASIIDLSLCSQKRHRDSQLLGIGDHRFFWNRTLHLAFQRYGIDSRKWLLRCMCGSVLIKTVYVGHKTAKACLISRLSCERMGTRFNVRGVNDDGHVANFVETEQLITFDEKEASFLQTRGSVPLFWEQPGVQVGSHKVKLSRGFEASAPAYDRHFKLLKHYYGDQVVVNLLGMKEGEQLLSQAFKTHHDNSCHSDDVPFFEFDYHTVVRAKNRPENLALLWQLIQNSVKAFDFFLHEPESDFGRLQRGTIRTNCLDCLDRTNCVQSFVGLQVLQEQVTSLDMQSKLNIASRVEEVFRDLWTENGDQCSRIYAGTGALEGKSKLKDASRSVARTIQNNLMDGTKQEAMDLFLLGTALSAQLYDRASALLPVYLMQGYSYVAACPSVVQSMVERRADYTFGQTLRVFCGTWNVNGGQRTNNVAFKHQQRLEDWLLDLPFKATNSKLVDVTLDFSTPVDIFAIGLEEIVDLNAQNIMKASTTNQRLWGEDFRKALCREQNYILITSLQLVGVCLFVFVRPHLAPFIRDLAVDEVKTGLGGTMGNKGCVAVRFLLHSTSFCFVCSHFAAGQSQVAERNSDFAEQARRVQFPMSRNIYSHDFTFWLGDFNYRIDLGGEEVKQLVREGDLEPLVNADQLTVQRNLGNTFIGFNEGELTFPPTYKYDTYSDDYDTSEKCRTPAWTDRILWRERAEFGQQQTQDFTKSRLLFYGRGELKTSDHRPVGALFDVEVRDVARRRREGVYREVVGCMGPPDATVLVAAIGSDENTPFPMELVDGVLAKVADLAIHLLLVKFVKHEMWLMFADGQMALAALSMDGVALEAERRLSVRLRSVDWEEQSRRELAAFDWATPSDDAGSINYALLTDGRLPAGHNHLFDAVEAEVDDEGADETPRRGGAAVKPARPPPPKLIQGGGGLLSAGGCHQHMSRTRSAEPLHRLVDGGGGEHPALMQRVNSGANLRQQQTSPPPGRHANLPPAVGVIGYPTNVSHVGAKTPEEAMGLINALQNIASPSATPRGMPPPPRPDTVVQGGTGLSPPAPAPVVPARPGALADPWAAIDSAVVTLPSPSSCKFDTDFAPPVPPRPSRQTAPSSSRPDPLDFQAAGSAL